MATIHKVVKIRLIINQEIYRSDVFKMQEEKLHSLLEISFITKAVSLRIGIFHSYF